SWNWWPGMARRFDCKPGDGLAVIGIEHEVGRELCDEAVERDCLYHAVGRQRHPREQRCNRHGAIRHRHAISDVTRHFDGCGVRPHQKLASREATFIIAHHDGYCRLAKPGDSKKPTRIRARMMARVSSRNGMGSNRNLGSKSRVRITLELASCS